MNAMRSNNITDEKLRPISVKPAVLASIIYSANETNIKDLMINGEWVKKDHRLILDETLLIQEVNAQVQDLLERGKGKAKVHF